VAPLCGSNRLQSSPALRDVHSQTTQINTPLCTLHHRKTVLRRILPFDDGTTVHRALGAVLALAAVGHTLCHIVGYRCGLRCASFAFPTSLEPTELIV